MTTKKGIKEQIKEASSEEEVDALIKRIKGYTHAHRKTVNKALCMAMVRKDQLRRKKGK